DTVRERVPVDHHVGLSFLQKVTVLVDPADNTHRRIGGFLQLWLWPAGLLLASAVLLGGAAAASRVGRGSAIDGAESAGRWMFTPPPPPLDTDIRVYRPETEWRAPLFWSLLGVAAFAIAVGVRSAPLVSRVGMGSAGLGFVILMAALSLANKTTEISADRS